MQASLTDIRQRWSDTRPTKTVTFWIVIIAIALTLVLGFTRGGWTTNASAARIAETSSQSAVVERLGAICVAQAETNPNLATRIEEMKALRSTLQRAAVVKEQGWATMPGKTTPDDQVASECAQQLMLLNE